MRNKLLVFSLMLLLILSALPARAESVGEAPSSRSVSPYGQEDYVALPPKTRAPKFRLTTVQEPALGREGIWSVAPVNDPGKNVEFRFILTDYEEGLDLLPTIYNTDWSASNTFSYSFYQAKKYCLFVYMQSDRGELSDYFVFTVQDVPGAQSVDSRVSEIVAECRAAVSGEYATALWLHDWITHHARYDYSYSYYDPEGILFHGTGVCNSYSKLYQLLLEKAGITSMRVIGTANGGSHAWNMALIDGVWCQIDVTWDDPGDSPNLVSGSERHEYFGLNDELMMIDHAYTPQVACTSLANYYPYRTRQHKTWMYHIWAEIEEKLAAGLTYFDVDTQNIIVAAISDYGYSSYYDGSVYKDYVDRKSTMAAALMSMDIWPAGNGQEARVSFTYDGTVNKMHCAVQEIIRRCGNNVFWNYDDGVLTIYGTGDMYEYSASEQNQPWHRLSAEITAIVLDDGVTGIGSAAFCDAVGPVKAAIADSVTHIGANAFSEGTLIQCVCSAWIRQWAGDNGYETVLIHGEGTIIPAVEPTCTESGFTEGRMCVRCGDVIVPPEKGEPALGHDWGEPSFDWAEDGGSVTTTSVCLRCGDTVSQEISLDTPYESDANYHWRVCPGYDKIFFKALHTTTAKNPGLCAQCGQPFAVTGFTWIDGAWAIFDGGRILTGVNGLFQDPNSTKDWYYCANGFAQTQYSGLAMYNGAWFYVVRGKLDTTYAGFVEYDGGLFVVGAGRIMTEINGLLQDPNGSGWYFFAGGQAQTQYTGLALYDGAWFYVVNGRLAEDYTGEVEHDGARFHVVNGMLSA